MKRNYYALVAHNCVAVFDNWPMAEKSRKYTVRSHFKKFSTLYEAEAYALEKFSQHYPIGYPSINGLEVNQIIFTKNQRPQNLMDAISSINRDQIAPTIAKDRINPAKASNKASEQGPGHACVDDGKYYIEIR